MFSRRGFVGILTGLIAAPLVVKADVLMPLRGKKLIIKPAHDWTSRFMNGKECSLQITDRIDEIADQILNQYGINNSSLRKDMIDYSQWCPDVQTTREEMLAVLMRG